jgi:putative two-component system response regulator
MVASRILVVDDEPSARSLYALTLESQGYVVHAVAGAEGALKELATETYDLLITDLMMPHVDGIGLARTIRRDARYVDMPIVLISALNDRETRIRALEVADAVMSKPLDMMELYLRLDMLIQGRLRVLALRERIELSENSGVVAKVMTTPEADGIVSGEREIATRAPRGGRSGQGKTAPSVRPIRSGRQR